MDQHWHPLVTSLKRAGTINPNFNMPVANTESGEWIKAMDLFQGDDDRLRDLVVTYGNRAWGTNNNRVAGSAFIIAYLTRLVYPAIGQYVMYRRVPNVSLDNVSFHWANNRIDATAIVNLYFAALPSDPAVGHSHAVVATDNNALYAQLKEWMLTSNVEIVIKALYRVARASVKVSQNAAAAACAQAFHQLYPLAEHPDLVVRDACAMLDDPASPIYRQVDMEVIELAGNRGFFGRRRGCCLAWRTRKDNGYCSDCILLSREQQTRQFEESLEGLS